MTLLEELRQHIATMAPHQRRDGQLLIRAADEIERLQDDLKAARQDAASYKNMWIHAGR